MHRPGPEFEEKRRYLRFSSIKTAEIAFETCLPRTTVRILDLSSAGARLETERAITAPSNFVLHVGTASDAAEKTVYCRLQWQRGLHLGVSFVRGPAA